MHVLCVALNPTIDVSSAVARVVPTKKLRTHNQQQEAGGGGVNVARMIAELGSNPRLLICSGGTTGAMLEDSLSRLPIKVDVVRIREMTRIAFMVHEEESNLEYRFVPEGPHIAEGDIEEALARVRRFRGEFVVASGSLPLGASDDTYARMARIAAANAVRFVLDTSGAPLERALEQGDVFLVKPSLSELEAVAGRSLDARSVGEAAMALVRRGSARNVAVTMGAAGALLASADGIRTSQPAAVPVRSAVGAGDAFLGAFVWSLARGDAPVEAIRWATAAGGAAVMTRGLELARKEDVVALHAQYLQLAL
jgi:6-phosphofructokinase 2